MNEAKFIRKYLRVAREFGEDQNPCYSRHIGGVIVDPSHNSILGMGYNGAPQDTPHPDDPEYLRVVVWPLLTAEEKRIALPTLEASDSEACDVFCNEYGGKKICPRKIIGAASGTRYELCSCVHCEANTIIDAAQRLHGSWLFIWGGAPCWECAKLLKRAGIKRVICTDKGFAFTPRVEYLLQKANIEVQVVNPEDILK